MMSLLKKILFVLLAVVLFSTATPAFATRANLLTIGHYSKALQQHRTFQVYLPSAAEPTSGFPVLFVLHGAYGDYKDWPEKTDILDLADAYRMILVFPDGGQFGWYVDSPIEKDSQYETYVASELVTLVDIMFPTLNRREGRSIMGLSMGGHGAMMIAAKHPDVFSSASSMSGILRLENHPDKWEIANRLGAYDKNPDAWIQNSVYNLATNFRSGEVRLMFDCGVADTGTGAIVDNRQFHDRLVELRVPHIYREFPGGHEWSYWQEHLQEHLNFHQGCATEAMPDLDRTMRHYFERLCEFYTENAKLTLARPDPPTVALLGSTLMEDFPREFLPRYHVFNRGIGGDVLGMGLRGISHRLDASVFDAKPSYLILAGGSEDLFVASKSKEKPADVERMAQEFESILKLAKARLPQTRMIVMLCPPVRDKYEGLAAPLQAYNNMLREIARRNQAGLVDAYTPLRGPDGYLRMQFSRDGMQLTKAGYDVVGRLVKEAVDNQKHGSDD